MFPMKNRIPVVGGVLTQSNTVLAAQRGPGRSLAGYWEFPGGKVEGNETAEAALARELQEELLINVVVGDFVTMTEFESGDAIVALSTYLCTISSGSPQLTEHTELRWVPVNELTRLDWAPADIPAVNLVVEMLQA